MISQSKCTVAVTPRHFVKQQNACPGIMEKQQLTETSRLRRSLRFSKSECVNKIKQRSVKRRSRDTFLLFQQFGTMPVSLVKSRRTSSAASNSRQEYGQLNNERIGPPTSLKRYSSHLYGQVAYHRFIDPSQELKSYATKSSGRL